MTQPRPLRVPTSPQREHILGEAEALRRYIQDAGPIDYFRSNRPGDRKRLAFVVDRDRYNRIRAALRTEQTATGPWIWTPKRGLHRAPSGLTDASRPDTQIRGTSTHRKQPGTSETIEE